MSLLDANLKKELKEKEKDLTIDITKEESTKDISTKYVKVPYTTEFAILFLPFEGLYAEAVNLGAIEILQREYNVVIAGPSTMAALLNSLQMGFKTLAIQENAERVWQVLGNVKSEFAKFADVLDDTQDRLMKVNDDIDKDLRIVVRRETDERDHNGCTRIHVEGEVSVKIGDCTIRGTFLHDTGTDNRSRRINHGSFDLLCRLLNLTDRSRSARIW